MKVLVYNNQSDRMETYNLALTAPMPYTTGTTLSVREFRGRSLSNVIWTDRRTMTAWNVTRQAWGQPIYVGYAFRRIAEGGHSPQSQHYAGMAFDVGQNLTNQSRDSLRNLGARLGVWSYVEPASMTPTWVHFDARLAPPACAAGYPGVKQGSRGVYVATLQDALTSVGFSTGPVDGLFGPNTRRSVISFQSANGLYPDGIVGCLTWSKLANMANGIER